MKALLVMWALAVGLWGMVYLQVSTLNEKVDVRVKAMGKQVTDAQTFRERIERMRPVEKRFNEAIPRFVLAKDIYKLYQLLGIDESVIDATPEKLTVNSVGEYLHNDKSVGVTSVCLNSGAGHLLLKTEDLEAALRNLETLAAKPWVVMNDVVVETTPGRPLIFIQVHGFCALLRDGE